MSSRKVCVYNVTSLSIVVSVSYMPIYIPSVLYSPGQFFVVLQGITLFTKLFTYLYNQSHWLLSFR